MHHTRITHVLLDIDDTLTCYAPHALERTFDGNFLFPLLLDLAETRKIPRREAETIIRRTTQEKPFWDYTDFLSPLSLSFSDVLPHFRSWHAKNLNPFPDSVRLTRSLKRAGYGISIISNNPRLGCLLKLERCGLANAATGESCFSQILSTDRIAGCKGDQGVWKHALEKALQSQEYSLLLQHKLQIASSHDPYK